MKKKIKKILWFIPLFIYAKLLVMNKRINPAYTWGEFMRDLDDIASQKDL